MNEFDTWNRSLKMCFLCIVFVNDWEYEGRASQAQIHQPHFHSLEKEDGCTRTQTRTHTHTHTHILTQAPRWGLSPLQPSQTTGEVELSDAAIRTTLSGRANKNEYFSPEISMGTYGGGLAHLQAHTHPHTHIDRYTIYHGCQDYSPPNHRCHNYHISITAQAMPTVMLIELLYMVYNISINMHQQEQPWCVADGFSFVKIGASKLGHLPGKDTVGRAEVISHMQPKFPPPLYLPQTKSTHLAQSPLRALQHF